MENKKIIWLREVEDKTIDGVFIVPKDATKKDVQSYINKIKRKEDCYIIEYLHNNLPTGWILVDRWEAKNEVSY